MTGPLRVLRHGPAPGARNMAVDEALMERARSGEVTLRLYRWDPPCLSLGRNQEARGRYDRDAARERGIQIVRRPTGGRAVLHHREITYAVTAPAGRWGSLRESYRLINRALLRGLAELGAEVREASEGPRDGTPGPTDRPCFRDPLPGEIVALGRKLVGSAQWRDRGALLQHGSILLRDDQALAEALRTSGRAGAEGGDADGVPRDPGDGERPGAAEDPGGGAVALEELLPRLPGHGDLADALVRGFAGETGLDARPSALDDGEESRARELEARYADEDWTWRR